MAIKINGDNSVATPGFTGDDTDTGLQVGTNELNLVTGGDAKANIDANGTVKFTGADAPSGLDTRITRYGSLLVGTDSDTVSDARCSIDAGNGNINSDGDIQAGGSPAGATPSTVGTLLDHDGAVIISRASGDVFIGKKQNTGVTSTVDVDGNAYFDGDLGIGTDSPSQELEVKASEPRLCLNATSASADLGIEFEADGQRQGHIFHNHTSGEFAISCGENTSGSHFMTFKTGDGTTRMRIADDGDVGIGVTPTSKLHVIGDEIRFSNSSNASYYGTITHDAADSGANIYNTVDATTASHIWQDDGTERMRLNSHGFLKAGVGGFNNLSSKEHEFRSETDNIVIWGQSTSSTYNVNGVYGGVIFARTTRDSNSAFALFNGKAGSDTEFNLRGDGNGYCDGSWSGGGADYAEYFEWSDGNSSTEDRRGISVVLDGDKIRQAVDGEEPIGVISGNPTVIGDNDIYRWKNKYLRDDFGTYIQEDYEVEDEEGNTVTQQRRKLNPDYNEDQEYIPREDRPEWDCVGLMGKIRIRKGQVTGSRWIKMRDISDSVEEWLVR